MLLALDMSKRSEDIYDSISSQIKTRSYRQLRGHSVNLIESLIPNKHMSKRNTRLTEILLSPLQHPHC